MLGGPGTGKTTTALWTAREELVSPASAPWHRVLFLTFSRTAVGQIGRRAPDVFAGRPERIEIATFHGFAFRLLDAFGRYAGHGRASPKIQSPARARLFGAQPGRLTYDDLLPAAERLLSSSYFAGLVARRWPLVICDEFQDTSDEQWSLLRRLGQSARLLLLADPNQMIYTFVPGVGLHRLEAARGLATAVVELEPRSHRDPTGVIPAMAESIRRRRFLDAAVTEAIAADRLAIVPNIPEHQLAAAVLEQIERCRRDGVSSVGIFAHSNEAVATLSGGLTEARCDHVLVGLPESHAAALEAMSVLCQFAVGGASHDQARAALATFLTASTRGDLPPALAVDLVRGSAIEAGLNRRLSSLETQLQDAREGRIGELAALASKAWSRLRISSGGRVWRRAAPVFLAAAGSLASERAGPDSTEKLAALIERRLPRALLDFDSVGRSPVQLMNFHQTKGREADVVCLVYRENDWFGREREPFTRVSRVLFVALTRARQRAVVILPPRPHPLVAPFRELLA